MNTLFGSAAAAQGITIVKRENDNNGEMQIDRFISISQKEGMFYFKDNDGNKVKFDEANLANVKILSIKNEVFNWNGKSIKSTRVTVKNLKTNKMHVVTFAHGTSKWRELARVMYDINERSSDFSFKMVQTKDFINLVVYEGNRRLQWAVELPAPRKVQVNGSMVSDYTEANTICDQIFDAAEKIFTQESLVNGMSEQLKTQSTTTQHQTMTTNIDDVLKEFNME